MYEIILNTWYQENPNQIEKEIYGNLGFEDIIEAVHFLNDNIEMILDEFPVDGEISIKFNQERALN